MLKLETGFTESWEYYGLHCGGILLPVPLVWVASDNFCFLASIGVSDSAWFNNEPILTVSWTRNFIKYTVSYLNYRPLVLFRVFAFFSPVPFRLGDIFFLSFTTKAYRKGRNFVWPGIRRLFPPATTSQY